MQWVGGELIDVTQAAQENNLMRMKMEEFRYRCVICKKLFSCEAGWRSHTEWMSVCGRTCTCDVFSYSKYSYSLQGTTGKSYQRTIDTKELKKLEALIETTMKKPELIEPEKFKSELETSRDIQQQENIEVVKKYKDHLATVEKWHETLAECEKSTLK